jgi:hypothetical protein
VAACQLSGQAAVQSLATARQLYSADSYCLLGKILHITHYLCAELKKNLYIRINWQTNSGGFLNEKCRKGRFFGNVTIGF